MKIPRLAGVIAAIFGKIEWNTSRWARIRHKQIRAKKRKYFFLHSFHTFARFACIHRVWVKLIWNDADAECRHYSCAPHIRCGRWTQPLTYAVCALNIERCVCASCVTLTRCEQRHAHPKTLRSNKLKRLFAFCSFHFARSPSKIWLNIKVFAISTLVAHVPHAECYTGTALLRSIQSRWRRPQWMDVRKCFEMLRWSVSRTICHLPCRRNWRDFLKAN